MDAHGGRAGAYTLWSPHIHHDAPACRRGAFFTSVCPTMLAHKRCRRSDRGAAILNSIGKNVEVVGAVTSGGTLTANIVTIRPDILSQLPALLVAGSTRMFDLDVGNTLTVSNNVIIGNSLRATATISCKDLLVGQGITATFLTSNNILVSNTLEVSGRINLAGTLTASNNVTFGNVVIGAIDNDNCLIVRGGSSFYDMTIVGDMNAKNITTEGALVSDDVTVNNLLVVNKDVVCRSSVYIYNDQRKPYALTANGVILTKDLQATGLLHVDGDAIVSGDTSVSGSMSVSNNAAFGSLIIQDTWTTNGSVTIKNLQVNGDATFDASLSVAKDLTSQGSMTINNRAGASVALDIVGGLLCTGLNTTTLVVANSTTVSGDLEVDNDLRCNGAIQLNTLTVGSPDIVDRPVLTVTGGASFAEVAVNDDMTITKNLNVASDVNVLGNHTVGASLFINNNFNCGGQGTVQALTSNTSISTGTHIFAYQTCEFCDFC